MWALLVALVSVWAGFQSDKRWVRGVGLAVGAVFVVLFLFLAVSDGVATWRKQQLADHLSKLRHKGRKVYTEWWTYCQDPGKAVTAYKEAEDLRVQIIGLLREKVSAAEADYFNTPRAAEPFPDTSLKLCPQAVLINEWGHRLERLGEVIQRLIRK